MEQETRAEVADLAAAEEYKKIERTYKTGIGLLLVNIPIYFVGISLDQFRKNIIKHSSLSLVYYLIRIFLIEIIIHYNL